MKLRIDRLPAAAIVEQVTLDLFPERSFEELCSECSDLTLTVHTNPRLKKNWYVKIHRGKPVRELYIPQLLRKAPEPVKRAVVNWATLPAPRLTHLKKEVRTKRRHYEEQIRSFLNEHAPASSRPEPVQKWPTQGQRYDLREVFDTLNRTWFGSAYSCLLRWGSPASRTSYEVTRKGPGDVPYHCITIAGIYNHPDIPRFAIESIMYHEMLHIHIPPRRENGRNIMHGPDFKKQEKSFPHYKQWRHWEHNVLPHLRHKRPQEKTLKRLGTAAARLLFH
jgi:hypothetical protein